MTLESKALSSHYETKGQDFLELKKIRIDLKNLEIQLDHMCQKLDELHSMETTLSDIKALHQTLHHRLKGVEATLTFLLQTRTETREGSGFSQVKLWMIGMGIAFVLGAGSIWAWTSFTALKREAQLNDRDSTLLRRAWPFLTQKEKEKILSPTRESNARG